MSTRAPFVWTGEHRFEINGSGLHEDTLRITQSQRQSERMMKLVLPTLCITYADMRFQNAVGGLQANYPASSLYGPLFFDPPVILTDDDIERLTYIRGAHQVTIGPERTVVEFPSWEELVIPRLRIDQSPGTPASVAVDSASVEVEEPLTVTVRQYADGRHVGGLAVEVRHPEYVPRKVEPIYDLWVRVIDGFEQEVLPEAIVEIWRWDPKAPERGAFVLERELYTDGDGVAQLGGLQAEHLHWYSLRLPSYRTAPRCLRPLAEQSVRLHMHAWKMRGDTFRYTWESGDDLDDLAMLTDVGVQEIVRMNRLDSATDLRPGMTITLPCYQGAFRPENWENLDEVARRFGMEGAKELAEANGMRSPHDYGGTTDLKLPEWRFFHARVGDTLTGFDKQFGLPRNSSAAAHRLYRPQSGALLPGEVVAVPSERLATELAKKGTS